MRAPAYFLILLVVASCSPYEPYSCTHYDMKLIVDPEEATISANVQMVFLPRQGYQDSICFFLNPGLEIHSLTAQALKYYEFYAGDTGNLVLYIQEPVLPNEQLHIAMSYSGRLDNQPVMNMDTSLFWYPLNTDARPCTFTAKFALPGNWEISSPPTRMGKHGKWLYQSELPHNSLNVIFTGK